MFKDPVFISLYLLVFAFTWIVVCGLLSWQTGWYQFARQHPLRETIVLESFNYSSLQFNYTGSYSYSMLLSIHQDGIGIRPLLLFKAFHKPFFISWKEISEIKEGKEFFWYRVLDVYIEGKKIRFYGKAIDKIKQQYSINDSTSKAFKRTT